MTLRASWSVLETLMLPLLLRLLLRLLSRGGGRSRGSGLSLPLILE